MKKVIFLPLFLFLLFSVSLSQEKPVFIKVVTEKANIRLRPDINSPMIHQVVKNMKLQVIDIFDDWLQVQTPKGEGWISRSVTKNLNPSDYQSELIEAIALIDIKINNAESALNELLVRYTPNYSAVKTKEIEIERLKKEKSILITLISKNEPTPKNEKQLLQKIVQQNELIIKLLQIIVANN